MNKSKSNLITIILVIALTIGGCILGSVIGYMAKPNTAPVTQVVVTRVNITKIAQINPTYTPYPTHTNFPLPIPATVIVVVTATSLPAPELSPTPEPPPTTAAEALTAEKQPGIYLVNTDIAPGLWRNNGSEDKCYWRITDRTGETIDIFTGQPGGTIFINPTDFQVELFENCGPWTYLSPP